MMQKSLRPFLAAALLGGCSLFPHKGAAPPPQPTTSQALPTGAAQSAEALDTTTEAQRTAAATARGGAALGPTVVSLGDPASPGFWLETPLVTETRPGRVAVPGGGSVQVELRPISGPPTAGSRISLAAMRLLGLPLTDLAKVEVYGL
jgi:hypothetical protein